MKNLPVFKIGCANLNKIMAGEIGLTEKQHITLEDLKRRKIDHQAGVPKVKPLTANMEEDLKKLLYKIDHPDLPEGAKTYCKEWIKRKMFNRKKDFKSIVIEKGLSCERASIKLIGEFYNISVSKNDDFFQNDYMHGEPDIVMPYMVRDTKSSWDLFTFPMFETEIPDDDYWWQLQGYMILLGLEQAALDYTLIDTPLPLVQQELRTLYFKSGGKAEEWGPDKYEELYPNYRFDDIPKEMRVKTFIFNIDTMAKPAIIERVELCRKYIDNLLKENLKNAGDTF